MEKGLVLAVHGDICTVEIGDGVFLCRVRKTLKRGAEGWTSAVAVGDTVEVALQGEGGFIESVGERRTLLRRRAAGTTPRMQPLAANADQLIAFTSTRSPKLNLRAADRLFCAAEDGGLSCALIINKMDLASPADFAGVVADYARAGYRVVLVSAMDGTGLDEAEDLLRNKCSVLCGPSGAGKSTFLNRLEPGLDLKTAEVSLATSKGKHTTTAARMFALERLGGRVIDTPGLREVGLCGVDQLSLAELFPEMRPHLDGCKLPRCTHSHEPHCAVKAAVDRGEVSAARYDSYLRILATL